MQPLLDVIAAGITAVRTGTDGWYDATTLIIHPTDLQALIDLKDTVGRPVFDPGKAPQPYGLTTVVSTDATLGTPLVGDPASIDGWIRGDVTVDFSMSHASFFTSGKVMFRCEGRFGIALRQPLAWCALEGFDS